LHSNGSIGAEKTMLEHDAPLSFFRDVFMDHTDLSDDDWFFLLANYYRVVCVASEENRNLERNGHKQNRPADAYNACEISLTTASQDALKLFNHRVEEFISKQAI
jgi:hypothetical protein